MASEKIILKCLAITSAIYDKELPAKNTMAAWYALLADIDNDLCELAFQDHMARSKWHPKPAEIRERAVDLAAGQHNVPDALSAWGEMLRICKKYSYGRQGIEDWKTDIPVPYQLFLKGFGGTIGGGMKEIGMSTSIMVERAHFMKVWPTLIERDRARAQMLPSVREASELISGSDAPKLPSGMTKLGDALKALAPGGENDGSE